MPLRITARFAFRPNPLDYSLRYRRFRFPLRTGLEFHTSRLSGLASSLFLFFFEILSRTDSDSDRRGHAGLIVPAVRLMRNPLISHAARLQRSHFRYS